ncbi:MAG: hypothetical protein OXR62_11545 [Ahrensia sp.]|nr:hypothetical protein [Ahrensia sp.]
MNDVCFQRPKLRHHMFGLAVAWLATAFLAHASLAQSSNQTTNLVPPGVTSGPSTRLNLAAKLTGEGALIERGMVWRVFGDRADESGRLPLIASSQGGSASFELPTGSYLVHAAYGRAGATKKVTLSGEALDEEVVLQAGGLQLTAKTQGDPIDESFLRFSIYEWEQDDEGNRKLIALNVGADRVIRLNAGTYHILSRYGTINATVRADLQVKAGEVTQATLQHRAAKVALRLVSQFGGDPIANTAWSVFTDDGEKVFESTNIAPVMVLAEGTYEAAVRHGDDAVRRTFKVTSGENIRVEIMLNQG